MQNIVSRPLRLLAAAALAAASIFFLYYTVRLATVWSDRAGPRPAGMFIGAVAFPVLCVGLGYGAVRVIRGKRGSISG